MGTGYVCKGNLTQCLLADRWERWLSFANATGLRAVLGLNGCFGRQSRSSPLNLSNAAALLAFSAKVGAGQPFSLELGNELSECVAGTARWSPYNCTGYMYSTTRGVAASVWREDAGALARLAACCGGTAHYSEYVGDGH